MLDHPTLEKLYALKLSACAEDIDYRQPRSLSMSPLLDLASCRWIKDRQNVLIT
jgi:hypothetical protein